MSLGPPTSDLHKLRPWPDNIDFCGYVTHPSEAVAQADVVVSLSHFAESFGRTVIEAMAAARRVITYDRGTPATLVRSGQTGFVARAVLAFEAARGQIAVIGQAGKNRAQALQALAQA